MSKRVNTFKYFLLLCLVLSMPKTLMAKEWGYSVKPGDSLWSICAAYAYYKDCWLELGEYNNLNKNQVLAVGQLIQMPLEWLEVPIVAANVIYFSGEVVAVDANNNKKTLGLNTQIDVGDRLTVGDGQLSLKFADGSTMVLGAQSEIVIDAVSAIKQTRQSSIEVSLPKGGATVKVLKTEPRNRFRITTPSGVAAVRGTEFRVRNSADQKLARNEVLEGLVGFEAQDKEVAVSQGFGVLAELGSEPSDPVELLPAPAFLAHCDVAGLVEWHALDKADFYLLDVYRASASGEELVKQYEVHNNYKQFTDIEEGCYNLALKGVEQGFYGYETRMPYCFEYQASVPEVKSVVLAKKSLAVELLSLVEGNKVELEFSDSADFAIVRDTKIIDQQTSKYRVQNPEQYRYVRARTVSPDGKKSEFGAGQEVTEKNSNATVLGILAIIAVFALL